MAYIFASIFFRRMKKKTTTRTIGARVAQLVGERPSVREAPSWIPGYITSLFQLLSPFFVALTSFKIPLKQSIDGEMGVKWARRWPQVYQLLQRNLSTRRTTDANRKYFCSMTAAAHVKTFLNCGHGLQNASSQVETSGSNSGFFEECSSYKSRNSSVWNHVFFVTKKQNLTQIFERHFQLNYSVGVRDVFMLFCLIICIWHANRVPDPGLRGRPAMPFGNQERLVLKFPTVTSYRRKMWLLYL